MKGLGKLIASIVWGIIENFLGRLRRDQDMKQEGREEIIENAHAEADDRVRAARQLEKDFNSMPADERERLREQRGIYRD